MGESEDRLLKKRFSELAARADSQGYWTQTAFLSPAEQALLLTLRLPFPPVLDGGYLYAERRIAAFGSEALFGVPYASPVVCLCMEPLSHRFADELTHRDFLGSLMGLGLEREVFGDILLQGNTGYVFCLDAMAPFIQENLTQVKRTSIRCFPAMPPSQAFQLPDISRPYGWTPWWRQYTISPEAKARLWWKTKKYTSIAGWFAAPANLCGKALRFPSGAMAASSTKASWGKPGRTG